MQFCRIVTGNLVRLLPEREQDLNRHVDIMWMYIECFVVVSYSMQKKLIGADPTRDLVEVLCGSLSMYDKALPVTNVVMTYAY